MKIKTKNKKEDTDVEVTLLITSLVAMGITQKLGGILFYSCVLWVLWNLGDLVRVLIKNNNIK